jgi:hypothetical protein
VAATEDISLRIALDDRQAQAGLDSLRQETAGLAQSAEGAAGGIGAISTKVDRARGVIEPTATAVNGMASAFGGLNTQTGAVLGGVSNLASAFMAGGPLALGLVTIGTGISWLTTKYAETTKAAQEAEKAQKEAAMATAKRIESLTQGLEGRISGALGADQAAIEMGKLQTNVAFAQEELDRLQTQAGRSEFMAMQAQLGNALNATDEYNKAIEEAQTRLMDLDIELANAEQAYAEYNKRLDVANRLDARKKEIDAEVTSGLKRKARATKEVAKATAEATEEIIIEDDRLEQSLRDLGFTDQEIFDQLSGAYLERQKLMEADRKAREEAEKAKTEKVRKETEERNRIQEQELKDSVNMGLQITTMVIGHGQQLFDDLITGQEKAFDRFMVNVMREAGTFMLGEGLKLGAAGITNVALGNPVGAGQLALAGGLVAGGIALGAVATGVEHTVINGGQIGQPLSAGGGAGERAISTPMGAGRISTGGTGDRDGGGMEQVTYVFNAPVFGDQNRSARHVAALQRRGQRNLLLA